MRNLILAASAAAALILLSAGATAAKTSIAVDHQKAFEHKPSGVVIAPAVAGLTRVAITQSDANQLDVAASFESSDQREITSIYVYRSVSGSVPLWFDRSQLAIERSPMLGSVTLAIPPAAFTPGGRPSDSGLRAVYTASGKGWMSSAIALTQVGEWYVKVRSSSHTLRPQELLSRLESTFAAIRWPSEKVTARPVSPIGECVAALEASAPAKLVKATEDESIMAALLGGAAQQVAAKEAKEGSAEPRPRFCREPGAARLEYGVYRPNASKRHYLIAIGDSGRAIIVGADELGALVARGETPARYGVSYVELDRAFTFPQFDRLPNFRQAIELVQTGKPISSSTTWGKKNEINISTGR